MTSLLDSALRYAELGYRVFPCRPNAKTPLISNGCNGASTDADQIEQWWMQWPTANIGLATDGLLVVDVDGADNAWLSDEPERAMELAACPLSITPRGGKHYIYQAEWGRNSTNKLAPKVDTRGRGGYILVAPSAVDGKAYKWINPLDVAADELPTPPKWLADRLNPKSEIRNPKSDASSLTPDASSLLEGSRNDSLTRLAGSLRRVGMSQAEIEAALLTANRDRCRPPLDEAEVLIIAGSVARYAPDESADCFSAIDIEADDSYRVADAGPLPADLLSIGGFLGGVIDWNLRTAYKPQPQLALGAALAMLATITGRKVRDKFNTRTNLYVLGVARSGEGKERAREVNKEILFRAGLDKLIGPEGLASGTGLVNAVSRQPAILFQLDEIGRILKTLGDGSRSPHLYGIVTVLMKMFTSSASIYLGDAYADAERNISIPQPHACLYGTTVPQSLYDGLTAESITDGFLARMLIFEAADVSVAKQRPAVVDVPERLLLTARAWGDFASGGNLSSQHPEPMVIEAEAGVDDLFDGYDTASEAARDELGDPLGTIWTRAVEKARKLTLLRACSDADLTAGELPHITAAHAEWGWTLAEHITRRIVWNASQWIAENPWDASCKRVLRIIEAAGAAGVSRSALVRRTQWLKGRDRNDIVDSLTEGGQITTRVDLTPGKAGRSLQTILSTRFL